jgi:hypothetical protein
MKFVIFWDIAPYSTYMSRRFGETCHLHLKCRKSTEQETSENWFSALKIGVVGSSELLGYIPENGKFHNYRYENLKSYKII